MAMFKPKTKARGEGKPVKGGSVLLLRGISPELRARLEKARGKWDLRSLNAAAIRALDEALPK